jgi:hypothetical protein
MNLSPVDRIRELGGELFLAGERLKYRIPTGNPEARQLLCEIRSNREAVIAMLRDTESKPPSREELRASLPPGVMLVSYRPKQSPFTVCPVSLVTNAGLFYRAYLRDLAVRLEKPKSHACPPLADILAKLADAGLELRVEIPTASGAH